MRTARTASAARAQLLAALLALALAPAPALSANVTRVASRAGVGLDDDLVDDAFSQPSKGFEFVTTPKDDNSGGFVSTEKTCVCVPYYQCDENQNVNVDGVGIIDIRIKDGQCEHYLDYCCKLPTTAPKPKPPHLDNTTPASQPDPFPPSQPDPFPPSQPDPLPTTTTESSYPHPSPYPDPTPSNPYPQDYPHPTPPPQPQVCGQRNPEGIGFRITGNEDGEAQFGEFPWMTAILQQERIESKVLNLYQCGGALISPQVVLTGAHCVAGKPAASLRIRAGEWDTQTTKELYIHQDRGVVQVIVHPHFNPGNLHNDIALLILSDPVPIGGHIGLICLPQQDQLFDHKRCIASGWGKDKFEKDGQYQVILKKRDLPIVPNPECQELLRRTRLGAYFLLDSSFICAGGEAGRDTCKGDGGSPLVCPMDNDPTRYYHAGIVAWGIDCGLANIPGVYGSVARFRHWIDSELRNLNLEITGYQV